MLALSDESDFEDRVQTRVEELRRDETDAEGSIERIKRELGRIAEERQWVITQARKRSITDADMGKQLAGLDAQRETFGGNSRTKVCWSATGQSG